MTEPHHECPASLLHDERRALPVALGVLLWCMRMSVVGMKRGVDVAARVEDMLDTLGAKLAAPHLNQFLLSLSNGCTRMIEVQCVCQKQISVDERTLLDVLSLAQAIRSFEAVLLLRGFVTQTGADAALRSAESIGTLLIGAGHSQPEPDPEPERAVRHYARSNSVGVKPPFKSTLH